MLMTNFNDVLTEIFEAAAKDGKITEEEYEIIKQVEVDIDIFNKALEQVEMDNILEPEEIGKLMDLRDRILERAEIVARSDDVISEDEAELLKVIANAIKKLI